MYNIKMKNVNIERVRVTKLLGVFIDELLNWKAQMKYVQSRFSKSIAIMHRCSHQLDRNSKRILYNMWKHSTNSNNIFLLQKRVIRIIFGARRLDQTKLMFQTTICIKMSRYNNIEIVIIYVHSIL